MKDKYTDLPINKYKLYYDNTISYDSKRLDDWNSYVSTVSPYDENSTIELLGKFTLSIIPNVAAWKMLSEGNYDDIVKMIQRQFIIKYGIETLSRHIGRQFPNAHHERMLSSFDVVNYLYAKGFGMDEFADFYRDSFHTTEQQQSWWGLPTDQAVTGFVLKLIAISLGEDSDLENFRMRRPSSGLFQPMFDYWHYGTSDFPDVNQPVIEAFERLLEHHWKTVVQYHNGSTKADQLRGQMYCDSSLFDLFPLEFMAYMRVQSEQGYQTLKPDHKYWNYPWVANMPERLDYVYDELLVPVLGALTPFLQDRHPAILKLCSIHKTPPPLPTNR